VLYQVSLTIPANTPADRPVEKTINVEEQVLVKIGAHFPRGCCKLPHAAIYYGRLQIWPSTEGEWVSGDDVTIWEDCFIRLPDHPTRLTLRGYNEDVAFGHTVTLYLSALPYKVAMVGRILAGISEKLARLLKLVGA